MSDLLELLYDVEGAPGLYRLTKLRIAAEDESLELETAWGDEYRVGPWAALVGPEQMVAAVSELLDRMEPGDDPFQGAHDGVRRGRERFVVGVERIEPDGSLRLRTDRVGRSESVGLLFVLDEYPHGLLSV